jgi:hypothetical protein
MLPFELYVYADLIVVLPWFTDRTSISPVPVPPGPTTTTNDVAVWVLMEALTPQIETFVTSQPFPMIPLVTRSSFAPVAGPLLVETAYRIPYSGKRRGVFVELLATDSTAV